MDTIIALAGLGVVIGAFYFLFSPPKKHKDFSLRDRGEATSKALGGGGVSDLSRLKPGEITEKAKKHRDRYLPVIGIYNKLSQTAEYSRNG